MPSIDKHRKSIDDLDDRILELILDRIRHVRAIRFLKEDDNLPQDVPEREAWILDRLVKDADGEISEESIRAIWGTLIREGKITARTDKLDLEDEQNEP